MVTAPSLGITRLVMPSRVSTRTPPAHPGWEAYRHASAEGARRDNRALVTPISPRGCRANEQADPTEWNSSDTASDTEETLSPQVSRPPGALDHRDQVEGGEYVDGCEGYPQEVPVRQPTPLSSRYVTVSLANTSLGRKANPPPSVGGRTDAG